MSVLNRIAERKRERLASSKSRTPLKELKTLISEREKPRDFRRALKRDGESIRFIAEIKKASPSEGVIRPDFDPVQTAALYENKDVDAISVITEEDFFQGSLHVLTDARKVSSKPLLRKDFLFDEYQIYESRAYSADAILLMAVLLGQNQADEYICLARELGMSVLFEIHNHSELEAAIRLQVPIIGINNRDLKTLSIDLNTSLELKKEIPEDRIVVSESGISTREDVLVLAQAGIDALLVGTSLMKSGDIGKKIGELRGTE